MRCAPITGEAGGGRRAVGLTQLPLALGMGFGPPAHLPTLPALSPPFPCVLLALGGCACGDRPSPPREHPLAADDVRTVQTSLLGLVREFLARSSATEDMQVVLSFLAAAADDGQVGWRLARVGPG